MAGPEIISMNMTSVMLVYSSLFARWAWVVQPRNIALCACHVSNVIAQANQMRRAIEHKLENGEEDQVKEIGVKAAAFTATVGGLVIAGPTMQTAVVGANLGPVSAAAGASVRNPHPPRRSRRAGAVGCCLGRLPRQLLLAQERHHDSTSCPQEDREPRGVEVALEPRRPCPREDAPATLEEVRLVPADLRLGVDGGLAWRVER